MIKYLQPKQYYIDLYDKMTVSECRGLIERGNNPVFDDKGESTEVKKLRREFIGGPLTEMIVYFCKGERYLKKEETILKWMDRDTKKDNQLESAKPPVGINCLHCGSKMEVESKMLHSRNHDYENEEVLFTFRCPECQSGRGFWEYGDEWVLKHKKCSKCGIAMDERSRRENKKVFHLSVCPRCGEKDEFILDLDEKDKVQIDQNYEKDRAEFCLSEEEGRKYSDMTFQLKSIGNLSAKIEEREKNKDVYDKIAKLQKLSIAQIQKLLTDVIEQNKYSDLQFSKPEFGRNVMVEFTCIEQGPDRQEHNSKQNLKKLIEKTLLDTTWRLMSDGINYRMGYLTGRIKAYESEDDFKKLVK